MAQRSRRPQAPVDYNKSGDAAKPAWMRAEDREVYRDYEMDASSDLDLDIENKAVAKPSRSKSELPAGTRKGSTSSNPAIVNREAKPLSERLAAHNKRDANQLQQGDTTAHQAPAAKKTKSHSTKGKQGKHKQAIDSDQHNSESTGFSSQQHNSSQNMSLHTSSSAQPSRAIRGKKSSANSRQVSIVAPPEEPAGADQLAAAPAAGGVSGRSSSSNGTHKKSRPQGRQLHGPASTNLPSKKQRQLQGSSKTRAEEAGAAEEQLTSLDIGTAANAAASAPIAAAAVMPQNARAMPQEPLAKGGKERSRKSAAEVLSGSAAQAEAAAPELNNEAAAATSRKPRNTSMVAQRFDPAAATADPPVASAMAHQHHTTGPATAGVASAAPASLFVPEAAALPQAAAGSVDGTPVAETSEFLQLQAEYSRLHAMYEDLKQQKIKELEGLVEEQESYVLRMGQEAKQLAEHWRMEAEQQRHSAACARAPETARSIKLLQDSKLAADQALMQKERELLQLQAQIAELHQQLATACLKPDVSDAGVQVAEEEIARDAAAAMEAAATPAPHGCQFAGVQCPTPAAPSPGVGVQYPTPAAAPQTSLAAATTLPAAAAQPPLAAAGTQSYATAADVPRFPILSPLDSSATATAGGVCGAGAASKGSGSPVKGLVTTGCQAQQLDTAVAARTASAAAAGGGAAVSGPAPGAGGGISAAGASAYVNVGSAAGAAAADTHGSAGCGSGGSCDAGGAAAAPHRTPGGINAFMFAVGPVAAACAGMPRSQEAAEAPCGAVLGQDFTFSSPQRAAAGGMVLPGQQRQQQQQAPHLAFPYVGEMQGSADNAGSCIVDKTWHTVHVTQRGVAAVGVAAGQKTARGGTRGSLAGREGAAASQGAPALGTPVLPAAPHNTPVLPGQTAGGPGFSTPGMSGIRGAHRPGTDSPALSSANRIRIREQDLQQVRLQLMTGIGKGGPAAAAFAPAAAQAQSASPQVGVATDVAVCVDHTGAHPAALEAGHPLQGGPGGAAVPAVAPLAPAVSPARNMAGQMGNLGHVCTSPGRVPCSPQGPGRTPFCTPDVTPQTSPALAGRRLQPATLAASLADIARQQGQTGEAGSSPQGLHSTQGSRLAAAGVPGAGQLLHTPLSVTRQPQEQQPMTGVQSGRPGQSLVMPTKMLCDFNPREVIKDVVEYTHSATGFVFQLHPADSRLTPATPLGTPGASGASPRSTRKAAAAGGDGNTSSMSGLDSSDGLEEEEEVTFVPISLGTAEGSMPEYLKEPITFAASQKAQFVAKLFTSLATATAAQAAAAAERPLQRHRRRSKHSDTQRAGGGVGSGPAAAAAEPITEDKENATGSGAAAAAAGKAVAADTGAAAAAGLAVSQKH